MGSFNDLGKLYPEWKKDAWQLLRTFVSAFLVGGSIVLINTGTEAFLSWANFLNFLVYPFLLAGAVAAVNAVGKLLRSLFGAATKDSLIDKLPF